MTRHGLAACLAIAIAFAIAFVPLARAQTSRDELMRINQAASDTATAAAMIPNIRSMIASAPDSTYASMMRQMLLRALVNSHATARQIGLAADSTLPYLGPDARQRVAFFASIAQVLADRGGDMPKAMAYARRSRRELGGGFPDAPGIEPFVISNLGFVHMKAGNADSAIYYFQQALPTTSDSALVLRELGAMYQKKGKLDDAISAYVRSLAVFPARDTTGSAALRAAYIRRYSTLQGLDPRLASARKASRDLIALDPRRLERAAPSWSLADLDGNAIESSSLAGKIVVMDFWGSWCGPCRRELPLFEALYQRYKNDDRVRFMGVNWERDKAKHADLARQYMTENNFSFPVVIDPEQKAVAGYGVQGFPTVFMIDAKGQIRFQNVGVAQDIDEILEAQLQSLLE